MIKAIIYKILERRHFWRYASFGEIADLYAARILRLAAMYLISGFTSVFLYKQGYSLIFIMSFWAIYYLFKVFVSFFAGIFTAKIGIAKGVLTSNLLYIPSMITLGLLPEYGIGMLVISSIFMGLSVSLNEICYSVEFSKIKSVSHAGKEIGLMNMVEKIAICISPIFGGLIALYFGVSVTMWVAGCLFALASIPLLKASHRSENYQRINVRGFPFKAVSSSLLTKSAVGFDTFASSTVWSLFIAIVLFPTIGGDIYVMLGVLSSVSIVVAIITSIVYGKIIDRSEGGSLLKAGVAFNALVYIMRIFTTTPLEVACVNVVNETATTAQHMAYLRGTFDTADRSGHRIMYLMAVEIMNNLGAVLACVAMLLCVMAAGDVDGFRVFYLIAAAVVSTIAFTKFRIYQK